MKTLAQLRLPNYSDTSTVPGGSNIFDDFMVKFVPDSSSLVIGRTVSRILVFAIIAAGLFFFVKLLSAGMTYLTSGGDSGKLQAASKSLMNAAIGLFIILSAFFIIQVLETLLGISII